MKRIFVVTGLLFCALVSTWGQVHIPEADHLVVDLTLGSTASNYPVSYLTNAPADGWSDEYKTTKMVFRRIPAGKFTMGSPADEIGHYSDETLHPVTLTHPYYLGVFEVTQRQWEQVMGTWPSFFTNASYRDSRPVETVSYDAIRGSTRGKEWPASNRVDADSFMGRLRARTGMAFDLPTAAQWVHAGRAGTTTALNSGHSLTSASRDEHLAQIGRYWFNGGANFVPNGDPSVATAKVGSYRPNAWGLYDIHGNVREWCLDWYGRFSAIETDPVGSAAGLERVIRGGCWDSYAYRCRTSTRSNAYPGYASYYVGFRAALPLSP